MPQVTKQNPDWIDVENMCAALGESYGVVAYFGVRLRNGKVEVTGKTVAAPYTPDAPVVHVALATFPVQNPRDIATTIYTVAFDLWLQHDGGGATAASRGAPVGWNGRVQTPRRRRAQ